MRVLALIVVLVSALHSLSFEQELNLKYAYDFGKRFGLGESVRAIVFRESSGGINLENSEVMACGWAQILVRTWKKRYEEDLRGLNISDRKICDVLKSDVDLNLLAAVEELKFWQKVHGRNNWKKIYASYYAGYNYKSKDGVEYSRKIVSHLKYMRKYFRKDVK